MRNKNPKISGKRENLVGSIEVFFTYEMNYIADMKRLLLSPTVAKFYIFYNYLKLDLPTLIFMKMIMFKLQNAKLKFSNKIIGQ